MSARRVGGARRVDTRSLEAALRTLMKHGPLIADALEDSGLPVSAAGHVRHALWRIVDDGFRSRETGGSS